MHRAKAFLLDDDAALSVIERLPPVQRGKVERIIRANLRRIGRQLERNHVFWTNARWGRTWGYYRRQVATDLAFQRLDLDEVIVEKSYDADSESDSDYSD